MTTVRWSRSGGATSRACPVTCRCCATRQQGAGGRPKHRSGRERHRFRGVPGLRRGAAAGLAGGPARALLRSGGRTGRARIVALTTSDNLVARYEAVRSSLDLGIVKLRSCPTGRCPMSQRGDHLPPRSAATTSAVSTRAGSGEDVDLCWRFVEAGARLRYEPIATVAHDHRTRLRDWLARKIILRESAAPYRSVTPIRPHHWSSPDGRWCRGYSWRWAPDGLSGVDGGWGSPAGGSPSRCAAVETEPREVAVVAAQGLWAAAMQLAPAICRHYWPVAFAAALSGVAVGWCWWRRSSTGWWTGSAVTATQTTTPNGSG